MIKLSNLDKYYNKGRQNQVHAVDNISMTLPDSGMIAFFGKSGCGKTTLLNMIGGLDKASSGSVLIDEKRIHPDADVERNLNVGYIFQNYNLSARMSVFDNVAASLRLCGVTDENEIEQRVLAALDCVDMAKFRKRLPTALSGGQQQRVAIARAIVKNPSLILADEPTGNLDEQNTVMVMDLLKAISRERLVLLVTHEAHLVDSYCDKVIGIADGKVFEERENTVTEGYKGKKTNEVYLGDMNREITTDGEFTFEYYGEHDSKPTKLRIISSGGTYYISADEGIKLKLADNSSELIVHEGKYVEKSKEEPKQLPEVLKAPLIRTKKAGRMYGFKGAVKSGYNSNFAKKRKRKKLLIAGMICFSMVMVFFCAAFGTEIYNFNQVEHSYNSHTVAVNTTAMSEEQAREIVANGDAEIYTVERNYNNYSPNIHKHFNFSFGSFETSRYYYDTGVANANIHVLPERMVENRKVLAGTSKLENETDIVITATLADQLIETANLSNVSTYRDILYAVVTDGGYYYKGGGYMDYAVDMDMGYVNSLSAYRVVGIVDGVDEELFFDDYIYLQRVISNLYGISKNFISDIEHSEIDLPEPEKGSIYILGNSFGDIEKLNIGSKSFKIAGSFNVPISKEELSNYSLNSRGYDITEGVEVFMAYRYGISNYEEWVMYRNGGNDDKMLYEQFLKDVNNEYETELKSLENEYLSYGFSDIPSVIMNREDMEYISTSYSKYVKDDGSSPSISPSIYSNGQYVFYSSEPDKLASKLENEFGDEPVITPDDAKEYLRSDYYSSFISMSIVLIVVVLVLSLCMYFIMRSALLGDIKEVGISRAIGVSRKNLCYRYFIESMVLFLLTVFIGYLIASAIMSVVAGLGSGVMMMVYYPWWLSLLTLAAIFSITAICGQIPIRSLLRKTPAQILAKYDI